jgi:hypothetical protein
MLLSKILLLGCLVGVSISPVFAQTFEDVDGLFAGIEGGISDISSDGVEGTGFNIENYGVKFGYKFNPELRAYVSYARSTGDYQDLDKFYIGTDGFLFLTDNLKLIAGLKVGYARLSFADIDSESGFLFGSKLGLSYDINQHNEIELGINADEIALDFKLYELGFYLGYNYKF